MWNVSLITHTRCSGSYGLIRSRCGPGPDEPSQSESHCVPRSLTRPSASSVYGQFCQPRPPVALSTLTPVEPANPATPGGTGSGSRNSPRCATKIRFGDSAKTPELPPKVNPGAENGLCHARTMSYGLAPTGPEIAPGVDWASSVAAPAIDTRIVAARATALRLITVITCLCSAVGDLRLRPAGLRRSLRFDTARRTA